MAKSPKPGGLSFVMDGWTGNTVEHQTFTCQHCQRIVTIPHKSRPEDSGGICYGCYKLICPHCVGKGCRPIEKWLEEQEAKARFYRELG